MLLAAFLLQAVPAYATAPIAWDSVRLRDHPVHLTSDGTRSEVVTARAKNDSTWVASIVGGAGSVRITLTWNDAGGCAAPHSVAHWLVADTLTVVTYDNRPTVCPAIYYPRDHTVLVTGLPRGAYVVRYFVEGSGGNHGPGDTWGPMLFARTLVFDRAP